MYKTTHYTVTVRIYAGHLQFFTTGRISSFVSMPLPQRHVLGITENDTYEHIECLAKEDSQLILCGVGGNGKFAMIYQTGY